MDFRNYFFEFGIVRVLENRDKQLSVDLEEKNPIMFIPGTNIKWRQIVKSLEITEQLGNIRTARVSMAMPLDLGLYILDLGLLSIAGIALYRFGYIGQGAEGVNKADILKEDWQTFMIQQPSMEVNGTVMTIEFSGVGMMFFHTRTLGPTKQWLISKGMTVREVVESLSRILPNYNVQYDTELKSVLSKDAFQIAKQKGARNRIIDGEILENVVVLESSPGMSTIDFFKYILAIFDLTFYEWPNNTLMIVSISKDLFIPKQERARVRLKWMGQVDTLAAVPEIPISSIKVLHNWFFLPRGAGSTLLIKKNLETDEIDIHKADPSHSQVQELQGFSIQLNVGKRYIGTFRWPDKYDYQILSTHKEDSNTSAEMDLRVFDNLLIGNLGLEVTVPGLPGLKGGDIVEVTGLPSSSAVRSVMLGRTVFIAKRFKDLIQLGGKYRIMKLTHNIGEGFTTTMTLLRTTAKPPISGEVLTRRKVLPEKVSERTVSGLVKLTPRVLARELGGLGLPKE